MEAWIYPPRIPSRRSWQRCIKQHSALTTPPPYRTCSVTEPRCCLQLLSCWIKWHTAEEQQKSWTSGKGSGLDWTLLSWKSLGFPQKCRSNQLYIYNKKDKKQVHKINFYTETLYICLYWTFSDVFSDFGANLLVAAVSKLEVVRLSDIRSHCCASLSSYNDA